MVGKECCVPAPPAEHSAGGVEEKWNGIDVYVNQSASAAPLAAVVLVSDIFGWKNPLFRKLVDKVAAAGFLAVAPDLLYGDFYEPAKNVEIRAWLSNHQPEKPAEDCRSIADVLNEKGITSIGYAGFCWGAKVAILAARAGYIKSVVMCHPSLVTLEDINAAKAAIAILAAETDQVSPVELIMKLKEALEQENKEHFVKVNPGTTHGWTVRYDVNDESAVKKAEEAHEDLIGWFQTTLL